MNKIQKTPRTAALALSLTACAVLTACGGGSVNLDVSGNDRLPPNPNTLSISGTAATGAAMAGASVSIQCASGAQTVTARESGYYDAVIPAGSLPCLIEASSADGLAVLHSVAEGSGSPASPVVANVTPITELVVAQVLGSSDTAEAFQNFQNPQTSSAVQQALTADRVSTALTSVKNTLATLDTGATLSGFDPIKDPFIAATATTQGDSKDQLIDALVTALTQARPDSATVTEAVKAFSTVLTSSGGASASPPATLTGYTAPPVSSCPAVRNTAYRIVGRGGSDARTSVIDWASGAFSTTWRSGEVENIAVQFNPDVPCQYEFMSGSATLQSVASQAGILVVRNPGTTESEAGFAIAIPEQNLALADLAGTWNLLEYSNDSSNGGSDWKNFISQITLDATGHITQATDCSGIVSALDSCSPMAPSEHPAALVPLEGGGYAPVGATGISKQDHLFAYRNAAGQTLMVIGLEGGGMVIGSRTTTLKLPAVGQTTAFWDIQASVPAAGATTVTFDTMHNTVQTVDASTSTVTRVRDWVNGTADGRVDSVVYNQPRAGLRHRPAGTYVLNGVTRKFGQTIQMPLPGLGLTVATGPGGSSTSRFMDFSVTRP